MMGDASSDQDVAVVHQDEKKAMKMNAIELIAAYRSAQTQSLDYEISGDVIVAELHGAEIARHPVIEKAGDNQAIVASNKQWLAPKVAAFAKFGEADVLSQSQTKDGSVVSVVSKDGRKYRVDLAAQTVNA